MTPEFNQDAVFRYVNSAGHVEVLVDLKQGEVRVRSSGWGGGGFSSVIFYSDKWEDYVREKISLLKEADENFTRKLNAIKVRAEALGLELHDS